MMPLANMIWQIADVQEQSMREMENAMGRMAAAVSRRFGRAHGHGDGDGGTRSAVARSLSRS